jgi:GMP synthase-like glutamine amidotransferase
MHPILIFRHVEIEGPGYLADFLELENIPYKVICLDKAEPVPENLDTVSALVFMGGPMSVNDSLPWINAELKLIRKAHDIDLPMLGHCLGGQLISKALGGGVTVSRISEIGWHRVTQVEGKSAATWTNGLENEFEVFHWHGETFSIPDGAELILSSQYCENQAFVIGKTLAMQCHIEMTEIMVREWVNLSTEHSECLSIGIQSSVEMLEDLQEKTLNLKAIANQIYTHWLSGLG